MTMELQVNLVSSIFLDPSLIHGPFFESTMFVSTQIKANLSLVIKLAASSNGIYLRTSALTSL